MVGQVQSTDTCQCRRALRMIYYPELLRSRKVIKRVQSEKLTFSNCAILVVYCMHLSV